MEFSNWMLWGSLCVAVGSEGFLLAPSSPQGLVEGSCLLMSLGILLETHQQASHIPSLILPHSSLRIPPGIPLQSTQSPLGRESGQVVW